MPNPITVLLRFIAQDKGAREAFNALEKASRGTKEAFDQAAKSAQNADQKIAQGATSAGVAQEQLRGKLRGTYTAVGNLAQAQTRATGAAKGHASATASVVRETHNLARSANAAQATVNALTRRLLGLFTAFQGARAFGAIVRIGTEFNSTVESSTLGIASLINAQAELTNETGRTLKGVEALDAAYELATEQVQKLRIAGIQTAATTEQLVEAFQPAVGAGLSAGLDLEQVRVFTVRATLAAAALGVPMHQLAQEVRSILDGTINFNSRVAVALKITNEQVKAMKEQGRLAEFLVEKFETFDLTGARAAQTFRVFKSNLVEAISVFAGDAVRPLTEQIVKAGNIALAKVFDFKTAGIQENFQGIVEVAQTAFRGVGNILASGVELGIQAATQLSKFFQNHREEVLAVSDAFFDIVKGVAGVVGEVIKVGAGIARWAIESGTAVSILRTVESIVRFIKENILLIGAALIAPTFLRGVGALVHAFTVFKFSGSLGAGLLTLINPIIALIAAVAVLGVGLAFLAGRQEEARQRALAFAEAQGQAIRQAPALAQEYQELAKKLKDGSVKGEELNKTQARLKAIKDELIELSPEFQAAFDAEAKKAGTLADATERVVDALIAKKKAQLDEANAEVKRLEAAERAAQSQALSSVNARTSVFSGQLANIQSQLVAARAQAEALKKAFGALDAPTSLDKPGKVDVGGTGTTDTGDAATKALNNLKQKTEAAAAGARGAFEGIRRSLDRQLKEMEISFSAHSQRIVFAAVAAAAAETAGLLKLLAATKDAGEQAKITQQINEVAQRRDQIIQDALDSERDGNKKLDEDILDARIERLDLIGKAEEAALLKLEKEFADTLKRLGTNSRNADIITELFNLKKARIQLDKLEKEIEKSQNALHQRIQQVEARQSAGLLTQRQARLEIAKLYDEERKAIEALLPALEAAARATGDPAALDRVTELKTRVIELAGEVKKATEFVARFKEEFERSTIDTVADFLSRGIDEVHGFADALRSLGASIVQSIRQILAREIAERIVAAGRDILGSLAKGVATAAPLQLAARSLKEAGAVLAGAALLLNQAADKLKSAGQQNLVSSLISAGTALLTGGGIPGGATGGLVRGPGTPTSDNLLARLSPGEFVVNAAAVKRVGSNFLHILNAGTRRASVRGSSIPGFASGGLVTARGERSGVDVTGEAALKVGLSKGLVLEELRSRGGIRVLAEILSENPTLFRTALGT